jgi:hypothetical protein
MQEKEHIFDKPANIRRLLRFFFLLCALLLALDFFHHRHVVHAWESVPGFYAVFGFIACVALVLIARLLRRILMRPEDYYER